MHTTESLGQPSTGQPGCTTCNRGSTSSPITQIKQTSLLTRATGGQHHTIISQGWVSLSLRPPSRVESSQSNQIKSSRNQPPRPQSQAANSSQAAFCWHSNHAAHSVSAHQTAPTRRHSSTHAPLRNTVFASADDSLTPPFPPNFPEEIAPISQVLSTSSQASQAPADNWRQQSTLLFVSSFLLPPSPFLFLFCTFLYNGVCHFPFDFLLPAHHLPAAPQFLRSLSSLTSSLSLTITALTLQVLSKKARAHSLLGSKGKKKTPKPALIAR